MIFQNSRNIPIDIDGNFATIAYFIICASLCTLYGEGKKQVGFPVRLSNASGAAIGVIAIPIAHCATAAIAYASGEGNSTTCSSVGVAMLFIVRLVSVTRRPRVRKSSFCSEIIPISPVLDSHSSSMMRASPPSPPPPLTCCANDEACHDVSDVMPPLGHPSEPDKQRKAHCQCCHCPAQRR